MTKRKIGILVMSYGTPEDMEQVVDYYTHIRRGNPPEPEQLQELKDRYDAIGGLFPLRKNTNAQVQALEDALNQSGLDATFVCYQGLKHAKPYIEDGVQRMVQDGVDEGIGIVLAPHYSTMSVGSYIKRAKESADGLGLSMQYIESYHLHEDLLDALTQRVEATLARFEEVDKDRVRVIYTAHSLPERILQMNDPYPDQLLETSKAISERAGVTNWQFAWQSAGQTATPWLGPDILDVLRSIHKEEGIQHVLICPIGFVSDHLEVLYDIDIECQGVAKELGMHLERTPSLNVDPKYIHTLADVILAKLN